MKKKEPRTADQDRDHIVAWFAAREGWTSLEAFIEVFKSHLTAAQGRYDLKALVKQGRLELRHDPSGEVTRFGKNKRQYRAVRVETEP